MPRTKPTTTWNRPRFLATAQLKDVSGNAIKDVSGNNIFVIGQSGTGNLVPKITTNWN